MTNGRCCKILLDVCQRIVMVSQKFAHAAVESY